MRINVHQFPEACGSLILLQKSYIANLAEFCWAECNVFHMDKHTILLGYNSESRGTTIDLTFGINFNINEENKYVEYVVLYFLSE